MTTQKTTLSVKFNDVEKEFLNAYLPQLDFNHHVKDGDLNREEIIESMQERFGLVSVDVCNYCIDTLTKKEILVEGKDEVISLNPEYYEMHSEYLKAWKQKEIAEYKNLNETGGYSEDAHGKLKRTFYIDKSLLRVDSVKTIHGHYKTMYDVSFTTLNDYTGGALQKYIDSTLTEDFNIIIFEVGYGDIVIQNLELRERVNGIGFKYGEPFYTGSSELGVSILHINL